MANFGQSSVSGGGEWYFPERRQEASVQLFGFSSPQAGRVEAMMNWWWNYPIGTGGPTESRDRSSCHRELVTLRGTTHHEK